MPGSQLAEILETTIKLLISEEIGIVCISCDQGAPNRMAYKKLGVTEVNPFITISNQKIFCIYDIVHLFKSVRNNLLVSDIVIDGDVVSWSILKTLFLAENTLIRSMHKLKESHISPDSFQKMNAKLATQVFSHHVSSAILAATATNVFDEIKKPVAVNTGHFFFD